MALSPLLAAQELPGYPDRIAALEALLAAALDRIEVLEDIIAGGGTPTPTPTNALTGSDGQVLTGSDNQVLTGA